MSVIVNGTTIPTTSDYIKVGGTNLTKVVCNGVTVWEKITRVELSFTGGAQAVTLQPGLYKIELWGASGGSASYNGYIGSGGAGGFTIRYYPIYSPSTYYVVCGGAGGSYYGGYNGGGNAASNTTEAALKSGGGGCTSFGTDQWEVKNCQKSTIIAVAGGGGGGAIPCGDGSQSPNPMYGGGGGGSTGGSSIKSNPSNPFGTPIGGGTQTGAGSGGHSGIFGKGGVGPNPSDGSGGGGGYYGGNAGHNHNGPCAGGGGSGYTGNSYVIYKGKYYYNTTTTGTNIGNGKALITYVCE